MVTIFGTLSILCCLSASFLAITQKSRSALFFQILGIFILAVFIATLWITLQRPPFRTMGETRIWYSFFLSVMSGVTYWRWKMNFLLTFTNVMAIVFIVLNIFKPELQSKALMPALQSVWFIPHVVVYMFAYAVIGCAFILGVIELFFTAKGAKEAQRAQRVNRLNLLIQIGTATLGIGMCLGAIWAKKAWGQYWSWDIKETAALLTWLIFLLYLHLAKIKKIKRKILLIILIIGFLSLNFTWYGVKYWTTKQKSPHLFYSTS